MCFRWNSTFFSSIPIVTYTVAVATNDVLTWPVPWNQSDSSINNLQNQARTFTRLNKLDCITYYQNYVQAAANVIIATNYTAASNNHSSFLNSWTSLIQSSSFDISNEWLCGAYPSLRGKRCLLQDIVPLAADWQIQLQDGRNVTAKYCLTS